MLPPAANHTTPPPLNPPRCRPRCWAGSGAAPWSTLCPASHWPAQHQAPAHPPPRPRVEAAPACAAPCATPVAPSRSYWIGRPAGMQRRWRAPAAAEGSAAAGGSFRRQPAAGRLQSTRRRGATQRRLARPPRHRAATSGLCSRPCCKLKPSFLWRFHKQHFPCCHARNHFHVAVNCQPTHPPFQLFSTFPSAHCYYNRPALLTRLALLPLLCLRRATASDHVLRRNIQRMQTRTWCRQSVSVWPHQLLFRPASLDSACKLCVRCRCSTCGGLLHPSGLLMPAALSPALPPWLRMGGPPSITGTWCPQSPRQPAEAGKKYSVSWPRACVHSTALRLAGRGVGINVKP